tara:strand:+ start:229 stop:870 length:642 start_codon:yes stop_codon:yes gene_type:complete
MAYFLGSDVEVIITTELAGISVKITETSNKYTIAPEGALTPTGGLGINSLNDTNQAFPTDALVDITGIDLGIGAMDEDIDYLGHNTPLKAEIRKNTTLTLTFKRKNVVFDLLYSGDEDGKTGRYGVVANGGGADMRTGLEEPGVDIGYRLLVKLKSSQEIFALRNCQITSNTITLSPDGTQEQSLEFTSMVQPLLVSAVTTTNLDTATGTGDI